MQGRRKAREARGSLGARRPAGNGPAGPAGSGAGRRAAASTEERRRQSFGVGGQRRGGELRSVPARDSQTPPGTVGISFLTLFLSGNSSPGRSRTAVPFAFSQMVKLRSRDLAVSEIPPSPRYSSVSAAPGAHKCGFMNGRRQVLAGCPGCVAQERDSELAAAARSRVPGRVSLPSREGAEPGPHPLGRAEPRTLPAAGTPAERPCEHHQRLCLGGGSEKRDL